MSNEEAVPPAKAVAKNKPSAIKDFIAGGVGGVCTVAAGHPLDTIKMNNFGLAIYPLFSSAMDLQINLSFLAHYIFILFVGKGRLMPSKNQP